MSGLKTQILKFLGIRPSYKPVEPCLRIMHGDLKDDYEKEVLDARDGEVRDRMMGVMNVMCGNVEIDCAYTLFDNFNSIRHGRNIFEQIGRPVNVENGFFVS